MLILNTQAGIDSIPVPVLEGSRAHSSGGNATLTPDVFMGKPGQHLSVVANDAQQLRNGSAESLR
jgi:hypothetical protein